MRKRVTDITDGKDLIQKLKNSVSDSLIKDLNKDMGNIAYLMGEQESPNNIKDFISTGSTLLDTIITNGQVYPKNGVPVGRLTLYTGDTSAGKSLMAAHLLINTQKMGGIPIIFDEESTIDLALLKRMGLKIGQDALDSGYEKPVYLQAGSVEKVLEAMEKIILKIRETNNDKLITIVWDSIASTPTNLELEGGFEQEGYGMEKAKLLSRATRKLTQLISTQNVLLLWTNQIRVNIGFGQHEKTSEPGGKAAPFHSTIRVRFAKIKDIKNSEDETIGVVIKAVTKKNKIAPYNRNCEFNIYFNVGVDDSGSWLDNLVKKEIIKRPTTQKYRLELEGKEPIEFKKSEWNKILVDNNIYDEVKQLVVKANTIDYNSYMPSLDDLLLSAKTIVENDEEETASED